MRTTIELTDAQRARLLELAGARGQKGFSTIVQEAVDFYLEERKRHEVRVQAALELRGTLHAAEADELAASVRNIHEHWR